MDYITQESSIQKKPYPSKYPAQENLISRTKLLLLKYIHQYLYILQDPLPEDTPDKKQCSSGKTFIPEELHKIFLCWRLRNQYNVITETKHGNLGIGETPQHKLGELTEIPKMTKGKTISWPTKFPLKNHMDIWYVNRFALEIHHCILVLVT